MKDFLCLGPTPAGEDCANIGEENYYEKSMEECKRYKTQLIVQFSPVPVHNSFGIKAFQHDFGTYHEVVVYFDDDCEESADFAFAVEGNLPEYWENWKLSFV